MINNTEEQSIDDILKSIRESIAEKEKKKYFKPFSQWKGAENDIYKLSKNMIVKRVDLPYCLGVWNFGDVADKIIKKYDEYFDKHNDLALERVRVKEENKA